MLVALLYSASYDQSKSDILVAFAIPETVFIEVEGRLSIRIYLGIELLNICGDKLHISLLFFQSVILSS